MKPVPFEQIFEEVIASIGGVQADLVRRINDDVVDESRKVTPQAVSKWKKTGFPPDRVLEVERAIEGRISRYRLRPDIYGEPPEAAA